MTIGRPVTVLVASDERLHHDCGRPGNYDACTLFVGYRLEASCVAQGTGWKIAASAGFTPYVLLRNIRHLPHEQLHLIDVGALARRYLSALESEHFESAATCRIRAFGESAAFGDTLRAFARDSNARLH